MKTKRFILLALISLAGAGPVVAAGTNEVSALLQKGLFEEEANRNLDAAMDAYRAVITQTDRDRQFAATAVFRLGECYRKEGKTNEANAQYQRILREFPEQAELVKLSREYAGNSAVTASPAIQTGLPGLQAQLAAAKAEVERCQRQIAELKEPDRGGVYAQQHFPNPVLTSLVQKLVETERMLAEWKASLGENNPDVKATAAAVKTIHQQIDAQIGGIMSDLFEKSAEAEKTAAALEKQIKEMGQAIAASPPPVEPAAPAASSEADEIRRLQAMIKDSPDLISVKAPQGTTPLIDAVTKGQLEVAKFLLDNKADIEGRGSDGNTPLLSAAGFGEKDLVELLISRGADVNAVASRNDHDTALHLAVEGGYKTIAETLLAHGAKINAGDNASRTPLHVAAKQGFKTLAEFLLAKGADVNTRDYEGVTPLLTAAKAGNQAMVQLLLAAKADVNTKSDDGTTPLMAAVEKGNEAMVELLLANRADVNSRAKDGITPLMRAAAPQAPVITPEIKAKATRMAKLLLQHGADVELEMSPDGSWARKWRALDYAVYYNENELVKLLLENHADPNVAVGSLEPEWQGRFGGVPRAPRSPGRGSPAPGAPQSDNITPLFMAVAKDRKETAQILLDYQADVNCKDNEGETPLWAAVLHEDGEMAAMLLNHKADANLGSNDAGVTPLLLAMDNHKEDIAELLLAHGADVNRRDKNGQTALHKAVMGGSKRKVELLLAHGADVNLSDKNGNNPLQICFQDGRDVSKEIAALLREHGAVSALERDTIRITRSGQTADGVVFWRDVNSQNHHTLFEVIAYTYPHRLGLGDLAHPLPELPGFYFPDFARVKIRRRQTNGEAKIQGVDLAAALTAGDCSENLPLEWGDIVELPELDHNVNENWAGLAQPVLETLKKCLARHVEIVVKGKTVPVALAPDLRTIPSAFTVPGGSYVGVTGFEPGFAPNQPPPAPASAGVPRKIELASFWLSDVVRGANVVLVSSDLTRVKVKRTDAATRKTGEMVFDLGKIDPLLPSSSFQARLSRIGRDRDNIDPHTDLWLQDGDVIEIPEKQ